MKNTLILFALFISSKTFAVEFTNDEVSAFLNNALVNEALANEGLADRVSNSKNYPVKSDLMNSTFAKDEILCEAIAPPKESNLISGIKCSINENKLSNTLLANFLIDSLRVFFKENAIFVTKLTNVNWEGYEVNNRGNGGRLRCIEHNDEPGVNKGKKVTCNVYIK